MNILVGGFHLIKSIQGIRQSNPSCFDRVDTKITDYFQTAIYLNNANWNKVRIA